MNQSLLKQAERRQPFSLLEQAYASSQGFEPLAVMADASMARFVGKV
jgi:hypothetical protein